MYCQKTINLYDWGWYMLLEGNLSIDSAVEGTGWRKKISILFIFIVRSSITSERLLQIHLPWNCQTINTYRRFKKWNILKKIMSEQLSGSPSVRVEVLAIRHQVRSNLHLCRGIFWSESVVIIYCSHVCTIFYWILKDVQIVFDLLLIWDKAQSFFQSKGFHSWAALCEELIFFSLNRKWL